MATYNAIAEAGEVRAEAEQLNDAVAALQGAAEQANGAMARDFAATRQQVAQLGREATAEFDRMDRAGARLGRTFRRALVGNLTDVVFEAKSARQALQDLARDVARQAFQTALHSLLAPGPVTASARGNAFAGGRVQAFAAGGIVSRPTLAPMALMGEAGPEAILPLKRGPDGRLGVSSPEGPAAVNVTMVVNTPDADSFRQSQRQMLQDLRRNARRVGR